MVACGGTAAHVGDAWCAANRRVGPLCSTVTSWQLLNVGFFDQVRPQPATHGLHSRSHALARPTSAQLAPMCGRPHGRALHMYLHGDGLLPPVAPDRHAHHLTCGTRLPCAYPLVVHGKRTSTYIMWSCRLPARWFVLFGAAAASPANLVVALMRPHWADDDRTQVGTAL